MSRTAARFRTILPSTGRTALGATIAGGVLTGLASAPERMSRLFRRRFPTVAVTGMTGVGKTQLADRLARRTSRDGVAEVGSAVMERRTRRSPRLQGFRFLVVPGDNAATRLGALDEVFHDEPVDGVIHVVANGYATPRRAAGTTGTATVGKRRRNSRLIRSGADARPVSTPPAMVAPSAARPELGRIVRKRVAVRDTGPPRPASQEPAGTPEPTFWTRQRNPAPAATGSRRRPR